VIQTGQKVSPRCPELTVDSSFRRRMCLPSIAYSNGEAPSWTISGGLHLRINLAQMSIIGREYDPLIVRYVEDSAAQVDSSKDDKDPSSVDYPHAGVRRRTNTTAREAR